MGEQTGPDLRCGSDAGGRGVGRHDRCQPAVFVAIVALVVAGVVVAGFTLAGRGSNADSKGRAASATLSVPSALVSGVAAATAAVRAADQAAAVATMKRVDLLYQRASAERSVPMSGLGRLVFAGQWVAVARNRLADSLGKGDPGPPVITYKARSWFSNKGTRVEVVSCHKVSSTTSGDEGTDDGAGRSAHFVMTVSQLAKISDSRWLVTADKIITTATPRTCSLNAPY